jgi:hypothetical protein
VAQSNVYSLNIVGYANVNYPLGPNIYANPFDKDGTNSGDSIFSYNGQALPDGSIVSVWTGSAYDSFYYENGVSPTSWAKDSGGTPPFTPPVLPPGKGFFLSPGAHFTNTFVGNVIPAPGTTNTQNLAAGPSLIGSRLPLSGYVTNSAFSFPVPDGLIVTKWTGSAYRNFYHEAGVSTTDWAADSGGTPPFDPPQVSVGEGFFYNPLSPTPWSQSLTNSP